MFSKDKYAIEDLYKIKLYNYVSYFQSEKSRSTNSIRSTPSPTNIDIDGLNLPMTAKEMRERIEKTKRKDPRKEEHGDWWKKHMIVQAL